MVRLICALLAALPLAAAAQDGSPAAADAAAASAPEPALGDRGIGRVYAGIGLGVSALSVGGDESGTALRLRLGAKRSPRLLLGLEAGLVGGSQVDLTYYDVGVTFFPWGRYLYLRGAAGLTVTTAYERGGLDADAYRSSEQGVNVLLGLGLALGRPRGLTVTLNVDGQTHSTSGLGTGHNRSFSSASAWLGVDWY